MNYDSRFVIDDGGRIGVVYRSTYIWVEGVPRGTYNGPSSRDMTFPIRGTFYYAWYPGESLFSCMHHRIYIREDRYLTVDLLQF